MGIETLDLPVVFFEEDGVVIAHCARLDVSSCGHDLDEARRNIRDTFVVGTLEEVLGSC